MKKKITSLKLPPARGHYTESARLSRVNFIREKTSSTLENVTKTSFDAKQLTNNIESFLGSVEIPIGIAGPLTVNGEHAKGTFYAPIATTEGALVASISRGAYAASLAGGITTQVIAQRMNRVPMFVFKNMTESHEFSNWINNNFDLIQSEVNKHSNYAQLIELEPQMFGKIVHVNFVYETGDASGQNMTTNCTWEVCKWIQTKIQEHPSINIKKFYIEGGLSADKRLSVVSVNKGRGISVQAEAIIPEKIVRRVLKLTPKELLEYWNHCVESSSLIGISSTNFNVANVIAGIYTATGQDIACVHESAVANTTVNLTDDGSLHWCISMPNLVVGTVGGGTGLNHQRECLEMLECYGTGKVLKFAEIIASFCLSLDLSTGSAIAAGHFATAHEKLGRNRGLNSIKLNEFSPTYFEPYLHHYFDDKTIKVKHMELDQSFELTGSIVTEMTSRKLRKTIGLFPFDIQYLNSSGQHQLQVMVKIKPTHQEVTGATRQLVSMCAEELFNAFNLHHEHIGIEKCDVRELAIFRQKDLRFVKNTPKLIGTYEDSSREAYVLLQERLINMELMDSVDQVSAWQSHHYDAAILGLAELHSIWYEQDSELLDKVWLGKHPTQIGRKKASELYLNLIKHARDEFPNWVTEEDIKRLQNIISNIPVWWSHLEKMPRTLIHNDFNPRNIAFRRDVDGIRLCAYDWELATLHIPQFDLAELLIYVLDHGVQNDELIAHVDAFHQALEIQTRKHIDLDVFRYGFKLAIMDFSITKMPMYLLTHTFRESLYIPRMYANLRQILDLVMDWEDFSEIENDCYYKKIAKKKPQNKYQTTKVSV